MFAIIGKKLKAAEGALAFCQDHPSGQLGYARVVARLEERVLHARSLLVEEERAHLHVENAVDRLPTLRAVIRDQLLAVRAMAMTARDDEPELDTLLQLPPLRGPFLDFLTDARRMLSTATPHAVLLSYHGLPDDFLEQLARDIDEFDRALTLKQSAAFTHVGASAALQKTCSEILAIVHQLDALHRVRFRGNAELIAAWNSARNIPWPRHRKKAAPVDAGSVPDDSLKQ